MGSVPREGRPGAAPCARRPLRVAASYYARARPNNRRNWTVSGLRRYHDPSIPPSRRSFVGTLQIRAQALASERDAPRAQQPVRTAARTAVKVAHKAIADGDGDASAAIREAASILDRAAKHNVIHKNAVARHKSRMVRQLNRAGGPAADAPEPKRVARRRQSPPRSRRPRRRPDRGQAQGDRKAEGRRPETARHQAEELTDKAARGESPPDMAVARAQPSTLTHAAVDDCV